MRSDLLILKEIDEFPGYFAGNDGTIYRRLIKRGREIKQRKVCVGKHGYAYYDFYLNKKKERRYVHRVIAETFVPNPNGLPHVNHKNSVRHDNRIENLEWCTSSDNALHGFREGNRDPKIGEEHVNAKLTEDQVREIRRAYIPRVVSYARLAEKYGVDQSNISFRV